MPTRNDLLQFLRRHYNLDEFKTACFLLDVEYDDLLGETLTGKMRELIALMERQQRTADLVQRLATDHPTAYGSAFGQPPAAAGPLTAEQARVIQALAQEVGRALGRDSGRFLYQAAYARLNKAFQVRRYHDISAAEYAAAVRFLEAWLAELAPGPTNT